MYLEPIERRWGPIYDAEQLKEVITNITTSINLNEDFYYSHPDNLRFFQGDVFYFKASVPMYNEEGEPFLYDRSFEYWMLISNTCDFERQDVKWSTIVPLVVIPKDVSVTERDTFKKYRYTKRFYIPFWPSSESKNDYFADLLLPVVVEKAIFTKLEINKVAQMSRYGWILLHSCLVRFLARDDGRFD